MPIALLLAVILGVVEKPVSVYAAEATVTFGSNWYDKKSGNTFPVGVYLKAEEAIGDYHIEITYDRLRLEYVTGADEADEENGVIILEGNGNSREFKYRVQFKAISGGEAVIEVSSVEMMLQNSEENEAFTVSDYNSAPVHIKGEDTAALVEAELERQAEEAERARLAEQEAERARLAEQEAEREREAEQEAEREREAEQETEREREAEQEAEREREAEQEAEREREAEREQEALREQEGDGGENALETEEPQPGEKKRNYIFFNVYFLFAVAVILLIVVLDVVIWNIIKTIRARRKKRREKKKKSAVSKKDRKNRKHDSIDPAIENPTADNGMSTSDSQFAWMDDERKYDISLTSEEELEWWLGRPVIKICDVTMEFRLSSVNPSGVKEYAVQLLKREVSYRRLYALYHVSFNVYKGEVIGIIGTNGSGKSTLLKIVSGALKPTEGHVEITGRRKVQLLTIGTGFDMELTARENVFLNGSIIGYSKNFLETHYDEIVEFAELQDFMEEKVKNFSSGMVSRLGFAIATAGKAAEILILDEVLSVGDEFFRKKSLKRIKEMIHGGSTVLMVSHSMDTILENCSRCVWIEKGELKMVGEPKVVCGEYRKLNG